MYVKLCTYAIHTWLWGTRSRRAKVIQLRYGALTSSWQHQQFFCDVDGIDFDKSSLHKGNGCHQNCRPKMETLKCNVSLRVRAWLHCLKSHKQTSTQKKKKSPSSPYVFSGVQSNPSSGFFLPGHQIFKDQVPMLDIIWQSYHFKKWPKHNFKTHELSKKAAGD